MKRLCRCQDGNLLSYAEYGHPNGFPILIQHGLIASIDDSHLFDCLLELGTRLICIARPGYGESSPYLMRNFAEWGDLVSVVIDDLGLSHFDVFGISSGAPYSYAIGCRFSGRVRNIFILSGLPALYDEEVLSFWPYGVKKNAAMAEMEKLAAELFFSGLTREDLARNDIRDSLQNSGFGVAQDLRLRGLDWGFTLKDVSAPVAMRHSRSDESVPFIPAELTSKLLPNCTFEPRENEPHFSNEVLDDFIRTVMAGFYL
jgi:pimeloyl-ACP methyl ester carboxylesterase